MIEEDITNYKKQRADLEAKVNNNEMDIDEVLDLLIEAREQRDSYKRIIEQHKK